jgi:tyrosyl-tRNA synthetase
VLARDITTRTHGGAAADAAISDAEALFSGEPIVDPARLEALFDSTGGFRFTADMLAGGIPQLLAQAGLLASNGEARRMVAGGGVTINGVRVTDPAHVPEPIAGEWLEVRIGKKRREVGRLQR